MAPVDLDDLDDNDPRVGNSHGDSGKEFHFGDLSRSLLNSCFGPILLGIGPAFIYMVASWTLFIFLRPKLPRVYAPKTISGMLPATQLSSELPGGWFNWFQDFLAFSDDFLIEKCSLDGFLFLRFLKVLCLIFLVGICFACPILLPLNCGGGSSMLVLTIGNVQSSKLYWAHVAVAWVYFGFILFAIYRECLYFVNFRHAHIMFSGYAHLASSKTVLFTSVPAEYLDQKKIRKIFGDSVTNIWIPKDTKKLKALIRKRAKMISFLEKAEITFLKRRGAVLRKNQASKQGEKHAITILSRLNDETGSGSGTHPEQIGPNLPEHQAAERFPERSGYVQPQELKQTDQYGEDYTADNEITHLLRPTHRLLSGFGRRVDTIQWAQSQLMSLQAQISQLADEYHAGHVSSVNAIFIEFNTYTNAQAAYQVLAHHQPFFMSKPVTGIRPGEIVWSSLHLTWWKRLLRQHFVLIVSLFGVTIWWFPNMAVIILNRDYLKRANPFFKSDRALALVTLTLLCLVRALVYCLLIETVPVFLRIAARFSGVPCLSMIELLVNDGYLIFQLLQFFLALEITSTGLLAIFRDFDFVITSQIPSTSIFFCSYILVRCLQSGAGALVQFFELWRHQVVAKWSWNPRSRLQRWRTQSIIQWGSIFPVFINIGVIAIFNACIAPLVLVFAFFGSGFVYFTHRYALIYIHDTKSLDTKGRFYPRAIINLIVGVYLAEIYLIAFLALKSAFIQLAFIALLLVITTLFHVSLLKGVRPLLHRFPRSLSCSFAEFKSPGGVDNPAESEAAESRDLAVGERHGNLANSDHFGTVEEPEENISNMSYGTNSTPSTSTMEGTNTGLDQTPDISTRPTRSALSRLQMWFRSESYQDLGHFQQLFFNTTVEEEFPQKYAEHRYCPPEIWLPNPKLWVPCSDAVVSSQETSEISRIIPTTNDGCWLDGKGRVQVDLNNHPFQDDLHYSMWPILQDYE